MNNLCFQMVGSPEGRSRELDGPLSTLRVDAESCAPQSLDLWSDDVGCIHTEPHAEGALRIGEDLLATLVCRICSATADPHWWLVPKSAVMELNGIRPLPLATIEPGDLLTAGNRCWLVTMLWTLQPAPAPEHVAARECPVCGGPLSLAPVVRCPCGRYYHLEKPDDPGDSQSLNCFLTGPCGVCHREASLEPKFLPSAEERLLL